jgi:hypothetical protein
MKVSDDCASFVRIHPGKKLPPYAPCHQEHKKKYKHSITHLAFALKHKVRNGYLTTRKQTHKKTNSAVFKVSAVFKDSVSSTEIDTP